MVTSWIQTVEGSILRGYERNSNRRGVNFAWLRLNSNRQRAHFRVWNLTSFFLVVKNRIQTVKWFNLGGHFLIQTIKRLKSRFFFVFLVNWARFRDKNRLFLACLFSAGVAVNQMASRHAWFALCVFSREGKFLLEAVFWGYSTILGQLDCRLFSLANEILAQGSWNFSLSKLFLDSWISDCFIRHEWYALWNFLLEAVGILRLSNYDWTIKFLIV